jgi:hypothetical protein
MSMYSVSSTSAKMRDASANATPSVAMRAPAARSIG